MQSLTLTLVMGALIGQTISDQALPMPNDQQEAVVAQPAVESSEAVYATQVCAPATHETLGSKMRVAASAACDYMRDSVGPMPQSAYGPGYGCYPGANNRYMQRYPAFHGYYNANPYNFRHLYEYPWGATPVQPSPMYTSTNTNAQSIAAQASNDSIQTPVQRKYRYNLHQPVQTVVVSSSEVAMPVAKGVPTPAVAQPQEAQEPQELQELQTLPAPQESNVPADNPVTKNSVIRHWQDDTVSLPVKKTIKNNKSESAKQAKLNTMYK